MEESNHYTFVGFALESRTHRSSYNDEERHTSTKVVDFLLLMVAAPGTGISKNNILDTLWPDQFVSEASISRLVTDTRQLLHADAPDTEFIQTVRGKGFRFVAPVVLEASNDAEPAPTPSNKSRWKWYGIAALLGSVLFVALVGVMYWWQSPARYTVEADQRIVVLPVWGQTGDVQDSWVEFGVMSMLTQQLREYPNIQVSDVDSVLSGLNALPFDDSTDPADKFD